MRICFVIADISEGGGTQRVTTQIANGLVTKGYEVHILAFRNGIVSAFHIDERVIVHSLHAERVKNSLKRKYRNTELLYSYIKNK